MKPHGISSGIRWFKETPDKRYRAINEWFAIRKMTGVGKTTYKPWMLAAIDQAGYNKIRNEHIDDVAAELLRTGLTEIDRSTFETACQHCGIAPDNFTQEDLNRLEHIMNAD